MAIDQPLLALVGAADTGAYQINQSLRFNSADSAYLNRTPAAGSNRRTFTLSFWIKKTGPLAAFNYGILGNYTDGSNSNEIYFNSQDRLLFYDNQSGTDYGYGWTLVFRDPSAWYHIAIVVDTTNATATDRLKLYVNGVRQTDVSLNYGDFPLNHQVRLLSDSYTHYIGRGYSPAEYGNYYLAEYNLIDGTALTPSSFGETDTITGAWIPKKYSGSYGTNGFYLKFESSGIGTDSSGNGNTWTPNAFVTSGFESDCMVDTPTSNHPTINPVGNTAGNVFTQGNLEIADTSGGGNWQGCQATIPFPTTGKWYYEMRMGGGTSNIFFGISSDAGRYSSVMHDHADTFAIRQSDCDPRPTGATTTGTKSGYGYNDIAGIAVNCDTGVIQFYKNGSLNVTFVTTFDPAKIYFASFMSSATGTQTMYFNFGAQGFTYTPPTGFKALNTANLPEPTIKKGGAHFNTVLYTGNGTTKSVSGVGFSPEFVWIKNRTAARNHQLFDIIRGTGKTLYSNLTDAESTNQSGGYLTSFDSDGFTVTGGVGDVNAADPYVSWNWNGGGAGSSNTAGTITSTVSANPTAGFSIVTYTGIAGDNISATVGHGLGVAPNLIIIKNRDWASSAAAWQTYHSSLPSTGTSPVRLSQSLSLDTTDAASGNDFKDQMNNTLPTSTVFSVSSHDGVSAANRYRTYGRADKYVAYCFSEVAGYSKFGSYVGNGSTTDGPFIWCGFTPRFILIKWYKDVSSAESWHIYDTARQTYNATNTILQPDSGGIEETPSDRYIDILSNGFKLRQNGQQINRSGASYIFAAFASTPFKYSTAR